MGRRAAVPRDFVFSEAPRTALRGCGPRKRSFPTNRLATSLAVRANTAARRGKSSHDSTPRPLHPPRVEGSRPPLPLRRGPPRGRGPSTPRLPRASTSACFPAIPLHVALTIHERTRYASCVCVSRLRPCGAGERKGEEPLPKSATLGAPGRLRALGRDCGTVLFFPAMPLVGSTPGSFTPFSPMSMSGSTFTPCPCSHPTYPRSQHTSVACATGSCLTPVF